VEQLYITESFDAVHASALVHTVSRITDTLIDRVEDCISNTDLQQRGNQVIFHLRVSASDMRMGTIGTAKNLLIRCMGERVFFFFF
jgi:hypothetical protein